VEWAQKKGREWCIGAAPSNEKKIAIMRYRVRHQNLPSRKRKREKKKWPCEKTLDGVNTMMGHKTGRSKLNKARAKTPQLIIGGLSKIISEVEKGRFGVGKIHQ